MANVSDRKFILNAEMLGGYSASAENGAYLALAGGSAGTTDNALNSGINNSNLISALNSIYAAGAVAAPSASVQVNGNGEFAGSAKFTAIDTVEGSGDISVFLTGSLYGSDKAEFGGNASIGGTLGVSGLSTLAALTASSAVVSADFSAGNSELASLEVAGAATVQGLSSLANASSSAGVVASYFDASGGNIYIGGTDFGGNTARFKIVVSGSILQVEEI